MDTRPRRENRAANGKTKATFSGNIFLLTVALILAVIAFLCYLMLGNVAGERTKEAGGALVADDFLVMDWGMSAKFMSDVSKVDMTEPGDYIVKVRYHGTDFYSTLHVVDTIAPVVTAQDVLVYTDRLPNPESFIQQVQDGTDVTVTYVQTPDMSVTGAQEVQLCVTDKGGNAVFVTANLTHTPDNEGPQILGVNKMSMYQGSTISYRSGVIVEDDYDPAPVLTVDSNSVDLSKPGTYDVTYRATDAAGNMTTLTTTLTVEEKPDSYVEESVINAKADEILAMIITDNMTATEKVGAVYDWIKENCTYQNTSNKVDRLQSAYTMMTTHYGDCYNYAALSSLFFERLGLPQINIKRSEDSVRTSKHFWNMVSVDGGETYYHFDVCPQTGFEFKVCLATDAELLACNQYTPGYYTFDEELYPATPLE